MFSLISFIVVLLVSCTSDTKREYRKSAIRETNSDNALANGHEPGSSTLRVTLAEDDEPGPDDESYGNGDDNIFDANDYLVFRKSSFSADVTDRLNDYNLLTAYYGSVSASGSDSIYFAIDFPGLLSMPKSDTTVVIERINIFNGERRNKQMWKNGGAVKHSRLYYHNNLIGEFSLANSYKRQSVWIQPSIALFAGNRDTILLVVDSIYSRSHRGRYSISEIKLEGERKY